MRIWSEETLAQIVVLQSPRSVLEHIRSNPGHWWKIITPGNPHWFCYYRAGRWIFSTSKDNRRPEHFVGAHLMLEHLHARSFELRLEATTAGREPIASPVVALVAIGALLTVVVLGVWLLKALGVLS